MAKSKSEPVINPTDQFSILKNPTLPIIEDHRGPLVYDRTLTPSLNGEDPLYENKDGV